MQPLVAPVDESGQHRAAPDRVPREPFERGEVVIDESRAQNEVLGRVAGYGELGEADEVGAGFCRALRPRGHLGDVAFEVADGGVDLSERDADHAGSLARTQPVPPMSRL